MTKALLLVDMSNDFIKLDGALNCGQAGIDVIPYCLSMVQSFLAAGDYVLDARDLHDREDTEIASGLFPPHNLRGTSGQSLIPELRQLLELAPEQWLVIEKKNYNAGLNTTLFPTLLERNIDEIHVVGVCTDICVRYTINGLYEWKTTLQPELKIFVHRQGVASFSQEGHEESLKHFPLAFGVHVVEE